MQQKQELLAERTAFPIP